MHSLVGLDAKGRPVTPLLTWADARAAAQAERLRDERPELHDRTGTPLHPMSPLAKLVWFRERDPETCRRVTRWGGVKELALERLTGEFVIDVSCASGTGLLGLESQEWDAEALAVAGVRSDQLARVVGAGQRLALRREPATQLGLGVDVPVIAGAGDGPLATLGIGAVRPGVAACSIGTSGALRLMVERPVVDAARQLFCYALTPDRWVIGGAISSGGIVLGWAGKALAPDLGERPEAELMRLAAQAPPGSDGLVMLPYLMSERAPRWDAVPRGAYVGLTRGHRRAHLVRAAVEGVCQQLALVLGSMRDAGHEIREVRATGGAIRNPLWRQILADAMATPIGVAEGHDGSSLGAALVAMEELGLIDTLDQADRVVSVVETAQPEPESVAIYERLRPVFADLHDALRPTFLALRRP
jgi:gluconokinase